MFKNKFQKSENKIFDVTALKLFLVISAISLAVLSAGASTLNLDNILNLKIGRDSFSCPAPYKYESCILPAAQNICESGKNKFMKTFILPENVNLESICTQDEYIRKSKNES